MDTLERITAAAGRRLGLVAHPDYSGSVLGLGLSIGEDLANGGPSAIVRKSVALVHRVEQATRADRQVMLSGEPPPTGSEEWDAFLAGLAEWLATRSGLDPPAWTQEPDRFLGRGWWVTPMSSMRAWEYGGSPVSLQRRGVYLHRDSLINR